MKNKRTFKKAVSAFLSLLIPLQLELSALPQSVFASSSVQNFMVFSENNLTVNTENASFDGSVYTGDKIDYLGSNVCYITKALNTKKVLGNIKALINDEGRSKMPDYSGQLDKVTYKQTMTSDAVIGSVDTDISGNIYSEGKLWIDRAAFSSEGYITANSDIQYDAVENAGDCNIFMTSENGNITVQGSDLSLKGIFYAPKGTIEINAKNLNIQGVIIARNIEFNGTNLTVTSLNDDDMDLVQFKPDITISDAGTGSGVYKENRKIVLDISESKDIDKIDTESVSWTISGITEEDTQFVKIDDAASDNLHKEFIITKAGEYKAELTCKDDTGRTVKYTKDLVVKEDAFPVSLFSIDEQTVQRNSDGKATLKLTDASYSPDGDEIGSRVWSVYFDSNNDGSFSDEENTVFNTGNEKEVYFTADSVGKYQFRLDTTEVITDSIPSLLTEDSYRRSNNLSDENSKVVAEVTNEAPVSGSGISKAKNVDIVVTLDNGNVDDIGKLNSKVNSIKSELEEEGYSVNLSAVSTSTMTAKDTFDWDHYDHYDYQDVYLPTLDKHIVKEGNSIKMIGYSVAPLRDWLFYDDGIKAKRVLSFDMKRDASNWHTIEGGGFLFNTSITEETVESENPDSEPKKVKILDGYAVLLCSNSFSIVKLDKIDAEKFRNAENYGSVFQNSALIKSVAVSSEDTYKDYNIRIVADNRLISVFINGKPLIENFVLPDTDKGTGFGPIICHGSHSCSQQSYFTFSNIKMTTVNGCELSEALNNYAWRPSADKYVINLSENKVYDIADTASASSAVKSLIEKNIKFIGLGTNESEPQYKMILKNADGIFIDWYDELKENDILKKYILGEQLNKDHSIKDNCISTSDEVEYNDYFSDKENDPVSNQIWTYDLDPSVYESGSGTSGIFTVERPVTSFDRTGRYTIKSKLMDDPTKGNSDLDSYKLWSNEVQWVDGLLVNSLPEAKVSSVIEATDDPNKFMCKLSFEAFDKDGLTHENKGITKEIFEWKRIDDNEWTEGTVPQIIDAEDVYLQKYVVCDEQNYWSRPFVEIIAAQKQENSEHFTDEKDPEINLTVSDLNPCLGDKIMISVSAEDDTGIATVNVKVNGQVISRYQGSVIYECKNAAELTVTAECEDYAGKTASKEEKVVVTDRRDLNPPKIEVDNKTGVVYENGKVTVTGSVYDDVKLDSYTVSYAETGKDEYTDVLESSDVISNDKIAEFNIPEGPGKYTVLITATDTSVNKSVCKIELTVKEDEKVSARQNSSSEKHKAEKREDIPAKIVITASADVVEVGDYVNVSVTAEDEDGLVSMRVYKDGKKIADGPCEFRFSEAEAKTVTIKVETTDSCNFKSQKTYDIIVEDHRDKTPPTAVIVSPENGTEVSGKVSVTGSAFDENAMRKYVVEYRAASEKQYTAIMSSLNERKEDELCVWDTYNLSNGEYVLRLTVTDNGGNTSVAEVNCTVKNGAEVDEKTLPDDMIAITKPERGISADKVLTVEAKTDPSLYNGDYSVVVKDKTSKTSVLSESGKISGEGVISASFDTEFIDDGEYIAELSARNSEGKVVKKTVPVSIAHNRKAAESESVCRIISPEDEAVLKTKTGISAEVSENIYSKYKFEYSPSGENNYTIFGSGDVIIGSNPEADFDTTVLDNGYYDIKFTAYGDGVYSSDSITVKVDGNMKIGNYNISFEDLGFEVNQIPVTLVRSYDSRNKERNSPFGYGWKLSWDSVKISMNSKQYENWEQSAEPSGFVSSYKITETRKHEITVDLGNGVSETFVMRLTPEEQPFFPIQYDVSVSYVPLSKTKSTLVPCGTSTNDLLFLENTLLTFDMEEYDPQCFEYTRADGTKYIIDVKDGLKKITYSSGETLDITDNGITASTGKYISFKHDDSGRITEAASDNGDTVKYEYDIYGDLVSVTSSYGEETEDKTCFVYSSHFLTEITDADGNVLTKNVFDFEGRLTKTIDADGNEIQYDHDIDSKESSVTDRNGFVTKYCYDDSGNITSKTDPNGNTVTFEYDENGNITSRKDALGNVVKAEYNDNNKITVLSDANGFEIKNAYDDDGNIKSIKALDKILLSTEYNDNGYLSEMTDSTGNTRKFEYDSYDRLTSMTDSLGKHYNLSYDSKGYISSATDGSGAVYSMTYDDDGNCSSRTKNYTVDGKEFTVTEHYVYDVYGNKLKTIDGNGNVVSSYTYDSMGNVLSSADKHDRKTTYVYDKYGNVLKTTYPDGTTEEFTYDKEGHTLTSKDREGKTTALTYDGNYNIISKECSDGSSVSYTYDAIGQLISETDQNGGTKTYEYDSLGRNTAVTDALGHRTEYTYDLEFRITSMKDSKGYVYNYTYDSLGNLIKTEYPDGKTTTAGYDDSGNMISKTDQNGNTTLYSYDEAGNVTSVTDALGNKTSYKYNASGKLISVTDANGNETKYEYDEDGREVKRINAAGKVSEKTYDINGNVLTSTDFGGKLTSYTYNAAGQILTKTTTDGTVRYGYDGNGNLTSVSDKSGRISYTYDAKYGLTGITYPNGDYINYSYDEAGNVVSVTTPYDATGYSYDKLGRMTKVVDKNGYATVYEYDSNGNRSAVRYANGIVVSYKYDSVNRLISEKTNNSQGELISQYLYTLGSAGEKLKVEELDRTVEYKYDELLRLVSETITDSHGKTTKYEYSYDNVGNRISKKEDDTETKYSFNELNQVTEDSDSEYEYDEAGNLISIVSDESSTLYAYDSNNNLVKVSYLINGNTYSENYEYDYAGNRTVKYSDNDYRRYLNDTRTSLTQVLAETDSQKNEICSYTRGTDLVSVEQGGEVSGYLTDGHGSVRKLCDENGTVTDEYTYDAWGNLIDSTGDSDNSFLYCGEQNDSFTGMYYLRARYMDPALGAFITMDDYDGSVTEPITLHKYLYANANPVMNVDPTGNFSFSDLSASMNISSKLDAMASTAARGALKLVKKMAISAAKVAFNAAKGAAFGAAIGAADAWFGEEDVVNGMINGAIWGAGIGAGIALLLEIGIWFQALNVAVHIVLCTFETAMVCFGLYGVVISLRDGHIKKAVFRAALSLFAIYHLHKTITGTRELIKTNKEHKIPTVEAPKMESDPVEGGEPNEGKTPGGEEPNGGKPSGEDSNGGKPSGEDPNGGKPSGEDSNGGKPSGEDPNGGKPSGEDPNGGKPSGEKPTEEKPTEEKPTEEKPTEEKPTEEKPTEEKPTEEKPTEEKPTEEKPTEEKPTEEKPTEEKPTEEKPTEEKPTEEKPTEEKPTEEKKDGEKTDEEKTDKDTDTEGPKVKYPKSVLGTLENIENFTEKAIKHIFEGEISKRSKAGAGYHYEGIEDTGGSVVEGTRTKPNANGVYEGKVTVDGVDKQGMGGKSTFFPKDMTPQDVIDCINEAYGNKSSVEGSRNAYRGVSSGGITVEMYLSPNGKIISAFPKQ